MMTAEAIRKEVAIFVGTVLLDQTADRSPMTAASAAYTLREWIREGVDLPDGITAPLLAEEWNTQVDARSTECYNTKKREDTTMKTAAEIISAGLFDAAVALMDDDIRETVHADLAPCSEETFLEEYMRLHQEKYGTPFTVLGVPGYTEKKEDDTMENRIDMDSCGPDLPSNWEEIADFLNDIIDERGLTDHDDVNALWEAYCSGDIPGAPEPKETTTRVYGNEKTALKLSKKAQALYNDTDPLRIEEIEATDGSLSYTLTGVIERSGLSADEVNATLEECYDNFNQDEPATVDAETASMIHDMLETLSNEPNFDTFDAAPNYHCFPDLCDLLGVEMTDFSSYGDLFYALMDAAISAGVEVTDIRDNLEARGDDSEFRV